MILSVSTCSPLDAVADPSGIDESSNVVTAPEPTDVTSSEPSNIVIITEPNNVTTTEPSNVVTNGESSNVIIANEPSDVSTSESSIVVTSTDKHKQLASNEGEVEDGRPDFDEANSMDVDSEMRRAKMKV